jgi:hypothetical protein
MKGEGMNKITTIILASMLLIACSDEAVEELAFRKSLEYNLSELCGAEDKACVQAVESQTKGCMEKSDWRKFLKAKDDPVEKKRFTTEFYACIVDPAGKSYFTPKEQ